MNEKATPKRVALVTGASSGIGRAIAIELSRHHFQVYAAARRLPDFFDDPLAAAVFAEAASIRPVSLDVNDEAAARQLFSRILAVEGRLDCLVQAAGYGVAGSVEDTGSDEARAQMETNFFGSIHLLPPVLEQMRRQKSGLIVQVGSVAGILPVPFQAYYSASKAALAALTLALADEVRPWGIRCLLVQPGDTKTGFTSARIMTRNAFNPDYAERCQRSVMRMAADEEGGTSADAAARQIVRQMLRRRPPLVMTIGFFYKLVGLASRLLPLKLVRRVIGMIYAG